MKILLLAGGDSNEREVSLNSSRAIYDSLIRQGHQALVIDPANGRSLLDKDGHFIDTSSKGQRVQSDPPAVIDSLALTDALHSQDVRDVEVVFIGLHGGAGENGSLQNLLELAGLKYTGSDMMSSAVAMNKAMAKRLMGSENILTPKWFLYRLMDWKDRRAMAESILSRFELPFIVKPNDGGSTVGLTKVKDNDALFGALDRAAHESKEILVEEFIPGREMTVSVLDKQPLPVVEIRPQNELYDYEAKYTKGKSEYIAPAPIPDDVATGLQEAALVVYDVVGASGLARVDFILTPDGQYFCLEINTLPGMTNLSLAPMAAKCIGMDFDALVRRIIDSALRK